MKILLLTVVSVCLLTACGDEDCCCDCDAGVDIGGDTDTDTDTDADTDADTDTDTDIDTDTDSDTGDTEDCRDPDFICPLPTYCDVPL